MERDEGFCFYGALLGCLAIAAMTVYAIFFNWRA
jgi:hypothetical protein